MAATVTELQNKRQSAPEQASRVYLSEGESSETVVRAAVESYAPSSIGQLAARSTSLVERADSMFEARVTWTRAEKLEPETLEDSDTVVELSVQAPSATITQSLSTVSVNPNTASTPRFKGAINVDGGSGEVSGVQWPPSTGSVLTVTESFDPARITQAYYRTLSGLVGTMNDATFEGFSAHELLLVSVRLARRGQGNYEATFSFGVSLNQTGLSVGDITGIDKDGWDYLWVYYREQEYESGGTTYAVVKQPVAAYVERIAAEGNFSDLTPPALP